LEPLIPVSPDYAFWYCAEEGKKRLGGRKGEKRHKGTKIGSASGRNLSHQKNDRGYIYGHETYRVLGLKIPFKMGKEGRERRIRKAAGR